MKMHNSGYSVDFWLLSEKSDLSDFNGTILCLKSDPKDFENYEYLV